MSQFDTRILVITETNLGASPLPRSSPVASATGTIETRAYYSRTISSSQLAASRFQLKAFYVDLLVPLETNLEKDTKVVQVSKSPKLIPGRRISRPRRLPTSGSDE